jgi:hypothetical protein
MLLGFKKGSIVSASINAESIASNATSHLTFNTSSDGSTLSERLRITEAGNIGIGITNPSYKLQVETPSSGIGAAFRTTAGTNNPGLFITTTESTGITDLGASGSTGTYGLSLSTGGTERMRIDSGGKVGIGTTAPGYPLTVTGDVMGSARLMAYNGNVQLGQFNSTYGIYTQTVDTGIYHWTGSAYRTDLLVQASTGNVGIGTTAPAEMLEVDGNIKVVSSTTCTIGTGTGATHCTSDRRLKDHIMVIPDALEKISGLRGITFHWIDPKKAGPEHLGVIAQEVEAQFPQIVSEIDGYKAVDYAALVAPLIEAVKTLKHMIDDIFSKLDTLFAMVKSHDEEIRTLKEELMQLRSDFASYRSSHHDASPAHRLAPVH